MTKAVTFSFNKVYNGVVTVSCEESIDVPICQPFNWLLSRLLLSHNIPKFAEKDFSDDLKNFVMEQEKRCVDERLTRLYDNLTSDDSKPSQIAASITARVNERVCDRFQAEPPTDEEIFGQTYTKIVQSPAAMDLIQLEQSFAIAVETEVAERNRVLRGLQDSIVSRTEALLSKDNEVIPVADAVSELQRQFHSEYEVQRMTWNSRISDLKETQRQDYRNFVMSVEEQLLQASLEKSKPSVTESPVKSVDRNQATGLRTTAPHADSAEPRSESFMIQLGRQLRTFYNLKLVQADPMDLMTTVVPTATSSNHLSVDVTINLAERLSSALAVYSHELTGLVIVADSQMFHSTDQQRFAEVCERSTDFHFPELDLQMAAIQETMDKHDDSTENPTSSRRRRPKFGDVYLTRHSNLRASAIGGNAGGGGGVQVVFHVVVDGDQSCAAADDKAPPAGRFPAYLSAALSAVLRACFQYDITTLSIPLLLTRRITDNMTLAWCHRRAEGVLRAVKGALMELASLRGGSQVLRTLIFLIPPDLPPKFFDSFSGLVNASFQQANPIVPTPAS
ncbi:unnamed protein product [Mesocestoides corti]|uniref:DUF2326 domain-containing protein n=1 Tax=Mesocestoides corti TaxID=53468 RepID=A0A0R3UI29_MESCO|nr:unnamed protein product [Mesocestoides corti]